MCETNRNRMPRLPEGIDMRSLCKMKGSWPTRELSQEELLDTYKTHYSFRHREESLRILEAFRRRYGVEIYDIVETLYVQRGREAGEAEMARYGSLLNMIVDLTVRPYCYHQFLTVENEDRLVLKVLRCPFADLVKEMGLEDLGRHICLPSHKSYAKACGYRVSFSKFLLAGDDCCLQVWKKEV